MIQRLSENLNGNDYVVGDIHGTFWKLEALLKEIGFNYDKDRLFSVGDMIDRGPDAYNHWSQIPNDVDVVITHGPVHGINDRVERGENVGDIQLLNKLNETTCKLFCCGHIHESYGVFNDGKTYHINAATCTLQYEPTNKPIVFIWNQENTNPPTL
jgi:predicted phosphodiesterase